MTTTSPPVARSGLPRAVAAQLVLGGVLLAHLTVVEVTFLAAGTGKNAVLTVAKFFALHAATLMVLQILLIARLPWLDRRLGMDRLTRWHRWVGFTLFWTVATARHAHPARLRQRLDSTAGAEIDVPAWPASSRRCWACSPPRIIVVVGATVGAVRPAPAVLRGLARASTCCSTSRSCWRSIHQLYEGTTFTRPRAGHARTGGRLWAFAIGALLLGPGRHARCVRNARHQFRVAAVVPESDNVVSVYVTGQRPGPAAGPGGPVLHLAVPRPRPLVAGQPVLAVGRARTAGRCG